MTYDEIAARAASGDRRAFAELCGSVSRQLYYIAYLTLKNSADAEKTVSAVLCEAFGKYDKPRKEALFCAVLVKMLASRLVTRLKEYKAKGVTVSYDPYSVRPDEKGIDIKQEFNRLTDLERLCMAIYAVTPYSAHEISVFTGVKKEIVTQKLDSAEKKLSAKIYKYL